MDIASTLAPFIAWLATREADEQVRRRYRRIVEHYLIWCRTDRGRLADRRLRYETEVARRALGAEPVGPALDRFAEYCAILDATRVVEL